MNDPKLTVFYRALTEIKPYPGNARSHSPKQIGMLANSIATFGFNLPISIDEEGIILAGHGRWLAAQKLGISRVPTVTLRHLKPAEKTAFRIADNRIAELSAFGKRALAAELALIVAIDPSFDIEVTGFDAGAIELLIDGEAGAAAPTIEPQLAIPTAGPPVCALDDVWELGRHRLICADATLRPTYLTLMGRSKAQMVFTDPPYNVRVADISGRGRIKHREFVAASGEMTPEEFIRFLTASMSHCARFSVDGALAYICMDWKHLPELHAAGAAAFDGQVNLCVWVKNPGMGGLYRSAHELIAVFKHGTRAHINNVELGRHGRNRSNVWDYPSLANFSATRQEELGWHPTVKPLPLVVDAILDASRREGLVLDAFGGSGTTLLAAEQTGRRARLIELDPLYCDVIIRRFENVTGIKALDQSGRTFADRTALALADGETTHD
ncbi:MAG: site-specific DNA-methyltransferase [Janthinobacterium lividum]